jgi:hypothetical protein
MDCSPWHLLLNQKLVDNKKNTLKSSYKNLVSILKSLIKHFEWK